MKKKKTNDDEETLGKLKDEGYLHNEEAINIIYQKIEKELEKDLEELENENNELIGIISNHIISLNLNLI